jgi:hypothetical protein
MKSLAEQAEANARKGILTADQVLNIRAGLARGEHPADIAIIYGVSEQTITRIRDGKTWFWLKGIGMDDRPTNVTESDIAGAAASFARLQAELAKQKAGDILIDELKGEGK